VTISADGVPAKIITITQEALTTGINDNEKNGFQIFPNPTSGFITVSFGTSPVHDPNVEIYNLEGMLMCVRKFHNTADAIIDLTGYPKGIYLVKVTVDGSFYNKKICLE
jgi:hypothetical protein